MPVVETDFLKALIDPQDRLHDKAVKALKSVEERRWYVASSAFLELDLLLKKGGVLSQDRIDVFESLKPYIPLEVVCKLSHQTLAIAGHLQKTYGFSNFYFDSLHLGTAIEHDQQIVSSDRSFDSVTEVKRIPLEKL
jgi:predicted nucleic acid-binding protein